MLSSLSFIGFAMKFTPNKSQSVHIRLSDEEFNYLLSKSEILGVSISGTVRYMIDSLIFSEKYQNEYEQINI